MEVSFYNFEELHTDSLRKDIVNRVDHIIQEGSFVEGPYNREFEKKFAEHNKVKHCLLVANGTDALEVSLLALGIKPGEKVGVPGITFYATAEAVINIGAIPVHIDVNLEDALFSLESLKRVHQAQQLKAVMPVHIYGNVADMENIYQYCDEQKIAVIEDSAQAFGGHYKNGNPVGSMTGLTTFSFYPTKNLSAFGDAGCILTQDDQLAEKIKVIRNHGRGDDHALGRNSRCDHIQAAVLDAKFQSTIEHNKKRSEIAREYFNLLKDTGVQLLPENSLKQSAWHLFPIFLKDKNQREALQAFLNDNKIGSAPFYEKAMTQEPPLKDYAGERENAENLAGRLLCLPMHPFLSSEQIQYVSTKLKEFLGK
jgi:dTDP-4-amino-4,6-dideoxygalactose transaminase